MVLAAPLALWVIPVGDSGGVARHVRDMLRAGIPGWRVVVACPPGPLADDLRKAGHPVVEAQIGPHAGLPASVRALRRLCSSLRPSIVHTHLSYADVVAAAAVPRGIKLVTTEHGLAGDDTVYHGTSAKSKVMAGVHTVRLQRFVAAIAVSQATATAMKRKWRASTPITVIPNGVDRPAAITQREPGVQYGSLSRLAPEKRIGDLLRAFADVIDRDRAAHLTVAGDGPLADQLASEAVRHGVDGHVDFPGFVDPIEFAKKIDVVAQLSIWENCSYTLLDAIVAGQGVVASNVGGNPEILPRHCLVDPDQPAQVAQALLSQAQQPELRPQLPADWPSVSAMTEQIADIYAEVTQ